MNVWGNCPGFDSPDFQVTTTITRKHSTKSLRVGKGGGMPCENSNFSSALIADDLRFRASTDGEKGTGKKNFKIELHDMVKHICDDYTAFANTIHD